MKSKIPRRYRFVEMTLLILLSLTSCGLLKDTQRTKHKTHRVIVEKGIRYIDIPMDSLVYTPKPVLKAVDTTEIIENKNLVLKVRRSKGRINRIKAIQKPKKEKNPYEKKERVDTKAKDSKSRGFELKPILILYVFLGLGFLILVNNLTKRK